MPAAVARRLWTDAGIGLAVDDAAGIDGTRAVAAPADVAAASEGPAVFEEAVAVDPPPPASASTEDAG